MIPKYINKIQANPYGVPLSKFYPSISLEHVVLGKNVILTSDISDSYKKGNVIKDCTSVQSLFIELLGKIQGLNEKIETLETTIEKQKQIIEELQNNSGSGGIKKWPDISVIDGGSPDDAGESGGTDEIQL